MPQRDAALEAQFGGRFNLVFTGTMTPAQSLDMVLRAVLDARAAGAENLHLLLVGDGMSRESLQALARELNAGDAVTFYGSVPAREIPKFTALADALLISLSDSPDLGLTVPGKLASYMAAGKPVVASMNGAGQAAVAESGGGLVSRPATGRRWRTTCCACTPCPPGSGPRWARGRKPITRRTTAAPNCCGGWKRLFCRANDRPDVRYPLWIKKFWC